MQPDPLGFIPGRNVYAYCNGDPANCVDPYGMDGWLITRPIRGTWFGEYADNSIDGSIELVDVVTGTASDSDQKHAALIASQTTQLLKKAGEAVKQGNLTGVDAARMLAAHQNSQDAALQAIDEVRDGEVRAIVRTTVAVGAVLATAGVGAAGLLPAAETGLAGAISLGAAGGAASSATSQAISTALGYQDSLDWQELAVSTVAGGLMGGITQQAALVALKAVPPSAAIVNATSQSKAIHKNALDYVGDTHVYRIKGPDGATFKIGESAQGIRVTDGASIRAEQQVRKLNRTVGPGHRSQIRRWFPDKASAREYETRLIERYRRLCGEDTLPGNISNR